ncbi:DUF1499 domain-containing protein [Haliea sp. AH-315-K21]|nr:DUF1499 domain-containing protein [Haliea sp. AH-315-K21]
MLKKIIYGFIVILVLLPIAFAAMFYNLARQSETLINAGLQNGLLQACPDRPSCVNSLSAINEHAIAAFSVPTGMADPVSALAVIIMDMPGTEILEHNDDYLHVTFSSAIFSFIDDLEIVKDAEQLQVRSVSRVGFSDMGVNRARVEELQKFWQQAHLQNQN